MNAATNISNTIATVTITSDAVVVDQLIGIAPTDYAEALKNLSVSHTCSGGYYNVGDNSYPKTWVIEIAIIPAEMGRLLNTILPLLVESGAYFQLINNKENLEANLSGYWGYEHLGKAVSIFPKDDTSALQIARMLIEKTKGFSGPEIPTNRHLGSIVYTRHNHYTSVPFVLPAAVSWPFGSIVAPTPSKPNKLLNYSYKLSQIIKDDIKGKVYKGFYFRKIWQIKPCIIKQGKRHIYADNHGRDITDRLRWQSALYQDLKNHVRMPEIFDLFEENNDTYLAIQFVKGRTVTDIVNSIYTGKNWFLLAVADKLRVLNLLLAIIEQVDKLHKKGYVHRDITPANFLIDKKDNIFLIDLELAYKKETDQIAEPFQLGTNGYMSPQQIGYMVPDYPDDFYAIGALMFFMFTNITPIKFDTHKIEQINDGLLHYRIEEPITTLILSCLNSKASRRPNLPEITKILSKYKVAIRQQAAQPSIRLDMKSLDTTELISSVQQSINSLTTPFFLSPDNLWVSVASSKNYAGHDQKERMISTTFRNGLSGIVYLLSKAKAVGLDISQCSAVLNNSLIYIDSQINNFWETIPPGLYRGHAGMAVALHEAITARLCTVRPQTLENLLSVEITGTDVASGISGQGLAILRCRNLLDTKWSSDKLTGISDKLLQSRLPNGSWACLKTEYGKETTSISFEHGISGIIAFLLLYNEHYPCIKMQEAIDDSLELLKRAAVKIKAQIKGKRLKSCLQTHVSFNTGIPGIVLPFLLAYRIYGKEEYKELACGLLLQIPAEFNYFNFSFINGLAGLGEAYLEAYLITSNPEFLSRAQWVSRTFHTMKNSNAQGKEFWRIVAEASPTAGLFSGNGGPIHFQLRMLFPGQISHLLLPS